MKTTVSLVLLLCLLVAPSWADPQEDLKEKSQEMLRALVELGGSQIGLAESGLSEVLQGKRSAESMTPIAAQAWQLYGERCSNFEAASTDERFNAENRQLADQLWKLCTAGEAHAEAFFHLLDGHAEGQPFDRENQARFDAATEGLKRELAKHGYQSP